MRGRREGDGARFWRKAEAWLARAIPRPRSRTGGGTGQRRIPRKVSCSLRWESNGCLRVGAGRRSLCGDTYLRRHCDDGKRFDSLPLLPGHCPDAGPSSRPAAALATCLGLVRFFFFFPPTAGKTRSRRIDAYRGHHIPAFPPHPPALCSIRSPLVFVIRWHGSFSGFPSPYHSVAGIVEGRVDRRMPLFRVAPPLPGARADRGLRMGPPRPRSQATATPTPRL